ncbi:MAG: VWA domain-containing protein [Desulfobacteraceae bacterium]|nr:MAG: VWA domain-containing protein [Desulfobacteraceae bacterium]
MKKVYLLWLMLFLLSTNLQAASGDAVLFEGEGQITPSPKSQELLDTNLLNQNAGDISVNIVSGEFPDIVLHITIPDSNGKPIEDLTASDFVITEQSGTGAPVAQTQTCFSESNTDTPISIAMVFDISLSMSFNDSLQEAKVAAINFLDDSQPGDRASLVTFSGCNQGGIVLPANDIDTDSNQNGTPDISEAITALTTVRKTAVYDGIGNGVDSIIQEAFPKGVIVFTDGESNDDCHYSINEVIQKAKDNGIPVYTIGLNSAMGAQLEAIATQTGGYYTEAPTAADMEQIYKDIAESIRGQYTICYTTKNPVEDGTLRTVTVNADSKTGSGTYTAPQAPAQPPVANAGSDMSVNEGGLVTLNGSASSASTPDGQLSFMWAQLSGTAVELSDPQSVSPVFTAPMTGPEGVNLVFELTVTDSTSSSASDTVTIAVNDSLAPEADFTWSPAAPEAGEMITFTDDSEPKGGDIVSWDWDFDGEGTSTLQNPAFTFAESGTYSVRMIVRDEFGSVGTAIKTITVSEPKCPGGNCSGSGGCFIGSAGDAFMME